MAEKAPPIQPNKFVNPGLLGMTVTTPDGEKWGHEREQKEKKAKETKRDK